MTRERPCLLQSIGEKTLESRSRLAGMLERKGSNVYDDLMFPEGMGLLELREGKAHVRKVPVVDCDALHITVPLSARVTGAVNRRGMGARMREGFIVYSLFWLLPIKRRVRK